MRMVCGNGQSGLTDNFSIERVDVTSGAHSLFYGNSNPGGAVNMVSKQARFRQTFARSSTGPLFTVRS